VFWHRSRVDWHPDEDGQMCSYPREAWFFINGVMTDDAVAQMNGDYLARLFRRPITLLQNSTDGLFTDLLECGVERLGATAEDVDMAFPPVMSAIKRRDKDRVVLIAHSQGTLIAAVVPKLLGRIHSRTVGGRLPAADAKAIHEQARAEGMRFNREHVQALTARELAKLEVYCIANCASDMPHIGALNGCQIPWIESFGNQHDVVARLGVLAPRPVRDKIRIAGPCYEHKAAWGHLLNAHYLRDIDQANRNGTLRRLYTRVSKAGANLPRRYGYLDGRTPAPYATSGRPRPNGAASRVPAADVS
jgi:hypothetical protein